MTVNGHVMGNHIGFVYVILQCFDQNVLRSRLCRLTILQFIVVPPHSTVEGHIFLFFFNLGVNDILCHPAD